MLEVARDRALVPRPLPSSRSSSRGYLALTIAYSIWLKHEAVLDLAAVAAGFVLRAIAGGVAVGVDISPWFLIVAGAGSLFMVTGKRRAELLELGDDAGDHRRSLDLYSHAYLTTSAPSRRASRSSRTACGRSRSRDASATPTWFELSIIPFVLGILRYALLLEQGGGGAPEELDPRRPHAARHRRGLGRDVRGGRAWVTATLGTTSELLTGWGRTAPSRADRHAARGASTRSSTA